MRGDMAKRWIPHVENKVSCGAGAPLWSCLPKTGKASYCIEFIHTILSENPIILIALTNFKVACYVLQQKAGGDRRKLEGQRRQHDFVGKMNSTLEVLNRLKFEIAIFP